MAYKILYLEDLQPESIKDDLTRAGYQVESHNTDDFEDLFSKLVENYDAYILDFRLTANRGKLDAPAIAQALRTKGVTHKEAPIVLISNEVNLKEFDKDLTSQDLFDFAVTKDKFRKELSKYTARINAFIEGYRTIKTSDFTLSTILGLNSKQIPEYIDYRLIEKLKSDKIKSDAYAYCRYINLYLVRGIGALIGEDILSARLGVSKNSPDWNKLKEIVKPYHYNGILSEVYDRWWANDILTWWNKHFPEESLRRYSAQERTTKISEGFELDLLPAQPIKFAKSTYFWTICMQEKTPLDPNEGYIINKKEYAPWQEMEYISLYAALEQSDYRHFLSPSDKREIREIETNDSL